MKQKRNKRLNDILAEFREHLLTANLCLQKTLAANIPLWIISLDLSKAFDKVNWEAFWAALMQHGVSQHLVWILQCIYYGQSGKVGWPAS